jgi:anti-sigma B factor antagonist
MPESADRLKLSYEEQPGLQTVLIALEGMLDSSAYQNLRSYISRRIDNTGIRNVILDLSQLNYVASSGWSALFVESWEAEKKGGLMVLFGLNERVQKSLDTIVSKAQILHVVRNLREGIAAVRRTLAKDGKTQASLEVEAKECALDRSLTLIRLSGHLDSKTVGELEARFDQQLKQGRVRWMADLGDLEYISSAGLKSFATVLPELRKQGGDLYFIGLQPHLAKIFKIMGFMELFKVFETEADAIYAYHRN